MTPSQKILSLIESVDPQDVGGMDEIDIAFWKFYLSLPEDSFSFICMDIDQNPAGYAGYVDEDDQYREYKGLPDLFYLTQVSRSRDALKAIRPEGWYSHANHWSWTGKEGFQGKAFKFNDQWLERDEDLITNQLPTEELAELHAIIQAIAHERGEG